MVRWSVALAALPLLLAAASPGTASTATAASSTTLTCSGSPLPSSLPAYSVPVGGASATGRYAYPSSAPKALVVAGHGLGGRSDSALTHLRQVAQAGALAVALDYRNLDGTTYMESQRFQYKVFTGAEDTAAAVADVLAQCGDMPVILWGWSMGGHVSAWTVMQNPGIADYLVMDVGPTNMPQLLATVGAAFGVASALGGTLVPHDKPVDPKPCEVTVAAVEDAANVDTPGEILADPVGTAEDVNRLNRCDNHARVHETILKGYGCDFNIDPVTLGPGCRDPAFAAKLVETSAALNAVAWSGSGLTHAYLVYASADTIVTSDHGAQFLANLQRQGVPATLYVAAYRGDGSGNGGYEGYAPAIHDTTGDQLVLRLLDGDLAGAGVAGVATPEDDTVLSDPPGFLALPAL